MNDMTIQPDAAVENTLSRADLTEAVRSTALLVRLTIGVWSGEKTDKRVGAEIKQHHNAVGDTGRYIKKLLAGCDVELKATHTAYSRCRAYHLENTLPWESNQQASPAAGGQRNLGARLLTNMLFHKYVKGMGDLERAAKQARDAFLVEYGGRVVQAQANLAGMGDPEDYPDVAEVKARFRIDIDFQPVPATGGFQGLPDAMLEKLGERLRGRQERAIAAAQADMWGRVREGVSHLIDRLEDPETRFKSSSVEAVRTLITLLPGFNCGGDARVNPVVADITSMLEGISAEDIRKNERVRQDVVAKAQALSAKLDQWGL